MYKCSDCGATDPKKHILSCRNSSYSRELRGETKNDAFVASRPPLDYVKVGGMVKAMQFLADAETGADNARELAAWLPDATIFWEYEVKSDSMGVRIRYKAGKDAITDGQMMPGDWMVYDDRSPHEGYFSSPWRLYTDEQFMRGFIPHLNGSSSVNLALNVSLNVEHDYILHNGQKYKLVEE